MALSADEIQVTLDNLKRQVGTFRERVTSGDETVQHTLAALLAQISFYERELASATAGTSRPRVTFASVGLR